MATKTAMEVMGHKTTSISRRYCMVEMSELAEASEKLQRLREMRRERMIPA